MAIYALSMPIGLMFGELLYRRASTFEFCEQGVRSEYWGLSATVAFLAIHGAIVLSVLITEQAPFFWR